MGRNQTKAKKRAAALSLRVTHPSRPNSGPSRNAHPRDTTSLRVLLPVWGFDWDFQGNPQAPAPNLNRKFVYRIQDAFKHTHDIGDVIQNREMFDHDMARIVDYGLKLHDEEELDMLETPPREFWRAVRTNFVNDYDDPSLCTHRRMTSTALHAFIAYAVESYAERKDGMLNSWTELYYAIMRLHDRLVTDRDDPIGKLYFERPPSAKWNWRGGGSGGSTTDDDPDSDTLEGDEEDQVRICSVEFVYDTDDEDGEDGGDGGPMEVDDTPKVVAHTCQTAEECVIEGDCPAGLRGMQL